MAEVIAGGYDFSATRDHLQLRLRVLLHQAPTVQDEMPRVGYQLRMVPHLRIEGAARIMSDSGMRVVWVG